MGNLNYFIIYKIWIFIICLHLLEKKKILTEKVKNYIKMGWGRNLCCLFVNSRVRRKTKLSGHIIVTGHEKFKKSPIQWHELIDVDKENQLKHDSEIRQNSQLMFYINYKPCSMDFSWQTGYKTRFFFFF